MMAETWICERHQIVVPSDGESSCSACMAEFENAPDAETMTGDERAAALENLPKQLTVPWEVLHRRIEALVGRPVWTHEMGSRNFPNLVEEARRSGAERGRLPTLEHLIESFPDPSRVVVVQRDGESE